MKTVRKIIEQHGGIEALKKDYIRIENKPYMRLVIEWVGKGPNGFDLVSVAHYYEQNGDLMRDPEMVFLVTSQGWNPYSFQQDNLGIYQTTMDVENARVTHIYLKVMKDLRQFAALWDRNLSEQGFLKVFIDSRPPA